jgi:hypothetical protein
MHTEVELGTMLYHRTIERREQNVVLSVNLRNGYDKQSVIFTGVAVNYGTA